MSAWDRTKRVVKHFAVNGTWYLSGVLGTFGGLAWALNIFVFLSWAIFLIAAFITVGLMAAAAIGQPPFQIPRPPLPIWLDIVFDGALAVIAVAFGHWFIGTIIVVQIILYAFIFSPHTAPQKQEVSS